MVIDCVDVEVMVEVTGLCRIVTDNVDVKVVVTCGRVNVDIEEIV